jgi:N-acetylglutamate synthase
MIRRLEELAANAWPGLRSVQVDGWVMRFAEGYTRRANSVLPLFSGTSDLEARIDHCEALAHTRGVEPTFKLTSAAQPGNLDEALERRGYVREADTNVMVLENLQASEVKRVPGLRCRVDEHLSDPWFAFYTQSSALTERQSTAARAIMEHIVPACRYVLLEGEDGPAACALTVVEDGWTGVFDVVVRKDLRGRGLGCRIMESVLSEAVAAGAKRSYLQVFIGNTPAEELYRRLGYTVVYPYWYRILKAAP